MSFIVEIKIFESIEGFQNTLIFPKICQDKKEADELFEKLLNHNSYVMKHEGGNTTYREEKFKPTVEIENLSDMLKESWCLPLETCVELDLIFIEDCEDYERLKKDIFNEKRKNEDFHLNLQYFKIEENVFVTNFWNNFSTSIEEIKIVPISKKQEDLIAQKIEELDMTECFLTKKPYKLKMTISGGMKNF